MWRCTPYQLTKRSFLCLRHFLFSFFLSQCLCVWGVFFLPLVQHIHLFLFIIRFIYIVSFHFSFSSFRSKSVDENWVITCWMQWSTTKFLLFQTKQIWKKDSKKGEKQSKTEIVTTEIYWHIPKEIGVEIQWISSEKNGICYFFFDCNAHTHAHLNFRCLTN